MRHLILEDELHRVDLGDGEWVDVKRYLSLGDLTDIEAQTGSIATGNLATGKAILGAVIRAWSFTNGSNQPVPVTPEMINHLSGETAGILLAEVNKLNPMRTETDEKKSSTVSTGPSRRERRSLKT
jgi:hypothetical protein